MVDIFNEILVHCQEPRFDQEFGSFDIEFA
jgi:hypothetical protein